MHNKNIHANTPTHTHKVKTLDFVEACSLRTSAISLKDILRKANLMLNDQKKFSVDIFKPVHLGTLGVDILNSIKLSY